MRQPMIPPNILTIQLQPHLIKRRELPLRTLAHAHPVLDALLDNWRIYAPGNLVHGDIAPVEGLGPEELGVDGDVVDFLNVVVGKRGDGDALAGAGSQVEFVTGLVGVFVGVHIFAGTAGVEVCPSAGGGGGRDGGCEGEKKCDLCFVSLSCFSG